MKPVPPVTKYLAIRFEATALPIMPVVRCEWASSDPLMQAYHDQEWGAPCHDDGQLFERLMLECFQAGLSWSTILRKRENFRAAFDGWNAARIAAYDATDEARLMSDAGIVRNRAKIVATIGNARAFLAIQKSEGSFDGYLWRQVGGQPIRRNPPPLILTDIPARTSESDALSKDLRRHGFNFVGTTMCYAFMQSVGMVNDHVVGCFRAPT